MNDRGMRNRGPGRLCAGLICILVLQSCTVSGAHFLTSNSGGEKAASPSYSPQQYTAGTIRVMEGDTLYSISKNNQINLQALASENGLFPPYDINPGDVLRIPGPRVHKVAHGETIYSISKAYNINALTLASLNGLGAPYAIRTGDVLQLPGDARSKAANNNGWRPGASKTRNKKGRGSAVGKQTRSIARAAPRGGGRFLWPAHGTIISAFGEKGGGKRNDGINIAVAMNSKVLAADKGTVSYVGNELGGYGNLILIRHRGDWVTAYAHNSSVWVEKGQAVSRGQHIANAGRPSDSEQAQVHFELKRGPKSVDPAKYLNLK